MKKSIYDSQPATKAKDLLDVISINRKGEAYSKDAARKLTSTRTKAAKAKAAAARTTQLRKFHAEQTRRFNIAMANIKASQERQNKYNAQQHSTSLFD